MEHLLKLKELISGVLFPPLCLICEKSLSQDEKNEYVCANCLNAAKINTAFYCSVCRARLANNKKTCHKKNSYMLAAASAYDDANIKKLIWRLKYKKQRCAAKPLAKIIEKFLTNLDWKPKNYLLMPVPLHPAKERDRGFNQSEAIAKEISKFLKLELLTGNLARIKNTKPQPEMKDLEARMKNIAGCFFVKNPELIKGKRIILVDDVFTSGSTMNEAVKILREAGAARVIGLVIAKV